MESRTRFSEFIGQHRCDAISGGEKREIVQCIAIANHKGHGHGFAKRASESENNASHYAGLGIGQDDIAHHFPGGAADPIRRFLKHDWRECKYFTHHGCDIGDDHDRQNDASAQQTDANWRSLKQETDQWERPQKLAKWLLNILGKDGGKYHQTPHPVDNRWNGRQQFNGSASGRRSHAGESSVKKNAMPKLMGAAIHKAMRAVMRVPKIGASAPKASEGGSRGE